MASSDIPAKVKEIVYSWQTAKRNQFANANEVLVSPGSEDANPFDKTKSLFDDVKSEVENGRALSAFK